MTSRTRILATVALLLALALVNGCAAMSVKPWDRDLMADKRMRFNPLALESAVDAHIYFSKEAATGGMSVGGGGCGCN
jgi:hypothetical protein